MNSNMFHIFSEHIASKGNNSNSSKREVQDQYTTAYKQAKDQGINLSKHWFSKPQLRVHGHIHPNTFEANAEPANKDHKQPLYPHDFQTELLKYNEV